jgi:hypothetical protein
VSLPGFVETSGGNEIFDSAFPRSAKTWGIGVLGDFKGGSKETLRAQTSLSSGSEQTLGVLKKYCTAQGFL